MIEKTLFNQILSRIKVGALSVTYWDGTKKTFGTGKPYFTMTINDPKGLKAIFKNMTLGFGEAYMDGLIEIDGPLDNVSRLVAENAKAFEKLAVTKLSAKLQRNTYRHQARQIRHHYDLGNDFYKLWLDESMTYTCAYFKSEKDTLEQAQQNKVEHVLKKLQLRKGMTLLDIGSGWGHLLITAAKKYGAKGLGVTLSKEQYAHCVQRVKAEGLEGQVEFKLMNYQDLKKSNMAFDRIVSVGMFEAVGRDNLHQYYEVIKKLLVPGGISVLHTITSEKEVANDPWIDKYIFPGGYIPSAREVVNSFPEYGFRFIDYENLRMHYARTLDEWWRRFELHKDKVIQMYDQRFYRMWRLYLSASSASFRYGDSSLSQFVITNGPNNNLPLTRDYLYQAK